jgi:hypothetical protein
VLQLAGARCALSLMLVLGVPALLRRSGGPVSAAGAAPIARTDSSTVSAHDAAGTADAAAWALAAAGMRTAAGAFAGPHAASRRRRSIKPLSLCIYSEPRFFVGGGCSPEPLAALAAISGGFGGSLVRRHFVCCFGGYFFKACADARGAHLRLKLIVSTGCSGVV